MRYQSQTIRLQTDTDYSQRLPIDLCGDWLRQLRPLMTDSVRMAVEGSSTALGRPPTWLLSASDVRFVGYAQDGADTLIQLALPSLAAAAPELYEQGELWPTKPAPEYTALDLFSRVVDEVAREDQDSMRYDRPLLRKLSLLRRLFSERLSSADLPAGSNSSSKTQELTQTTADLAGRLANSTPWPQEVRVVGLLDMVRRSTRSFGLQLEDGTEIQGVLENADDVEQLRQYFGKRALVFGQAVYRPSGSLLRIDAHAIEPGDRQPSIFSKVPPPRARQLSPTRKISTRQGWASLASYFREWPGEETDEQWNKMRRELRR